MSIDELAKEICRQEGLDPHERVIASPDETWTQDERSEHTYAPDIGMNVERWQTYRARAERLLAEQDALELTFGPGVSVFPPETLTQASTGAIAVTRRALAEEAKCTTKPERILTRHYTNGIINARADDDPWHYPPSSAASEGEYIRADLGSFYQEKDIDALLAERDNLRSIIRALLDCPHIADCDPHPETEAAISRAMSALANTENGHD